MTTPLARRRFLQTMAAITGSLQLRAPAYAQGGASSGLPPPRPDSSGSTHELTISKRKLKIAGRDATATVVNGTIPGPLLRFPEGETVTIHVTNAMDETTSIHWHGVLVPHDMDGVPGVSFAGIPSRSTFTYRFKLRQSGTYWYHSHSAMQEQTGLYGPLIIDPSKKDPARVDREHVVQLSDWTYENPDRVMARLKKQGNYYNFERRTIADFFRDTSRDGLGATLSDRLMWGRMRMDPTDILDVTGYTYRYLLNGLSPELNWTGLVKSGERVRLRFINSAAMTIFDVRIPGLKMTVVQADGQDVQPVVVDELRIAVAETYDVIVEPGGEGAYTVFAEAMDRSGYATGTLAEREGMRAAIPARRKRPLRTMADMGMAGHAGMKDMPGMKMPSNGGQAETQGHGDMSGMKDMPGMKMLPQSAQSPPQDHGDMPGMRMPPAGEHAGHAQAQGVSASSAKPYVHGPDTHGPGNSMVAKMPTSRLDEPGVGFEDSDRKVLVYTDLKRRERNRERRGNTGAMLLGITGQDAVARVDRAGADPFAEPADRRRQPAEPHLVDMVRRGPDAVLAWTVWAQSGVKLARVSP